MDKKITKIVFCLAVVISLVGVGWYSHAWYHSHHESTKVRRVSAKGFSFTSPLLDVELPEGMGVNYEPLPFKHRIDAFLKDQQ